MSSFVSIIIPTFNRAHLIIETLGSVLAQTYKNWECIVVDDGSTDHTKEVMAAFCKKDSRFQYYQRPNNKPKGANACRNYGLELSKGEYINWFDSDDLMHKDKLKIQVEQLHNSSYNYVICQTMMFDVKNNKEIGLKSSRLRSDNIFEDYILFKIFWLTGAPLWKKSFLLINNLTFNEKLQQAQDYDFHMRVLEISENYFDYEVPLVTFNFHNENMSIATNDTPEKIFSNILIRHIILKKYFNKLSKSTIVKKYRELLNFYKSNLRNKKYKVAYFCYKSLVTNLKALNMGFIKKIFFIFQISLSLAVFFLFKRGDKLLKFNI